MLSGCFQPALPRAAGSEVADVEDETSEVDIVPGLAVPEGLVASVDRNTDVELVWQPVAGAGGYRVARCELIGDSCEGEVVLNGGAPVAETRFTDTTASAPGLPTAPTVTATRERADDVRVTWEPVVAPSAPRYQYRVAAVSGDDVGESAVAIGSRAERPVTGYEVKVDDASWVSLDAGATMWVHVDAAPPTLVAGVASASEGTYAEFVRLSTTVAQALVGAEHTYRVRALTAYAVGEDGLAKGLGRLGTSPINGSVRRGPRRMSFRPFRGLKGWSSMMHRRRRMARCDGIACGSTRRGQSRSGVRRWSGRGSRRPVCRAM